MTEPSKFDILKHAVALPHWYQFIVRPMGEKVYVDFCMGGETEPYAASLSFRSFREALGAYGAENISDSEYMNDQFTALGQFNFVITGNSDPDLITDLDIAFHERMPEGKRGDQDFFVSKMAIGAGLVSAKLLENEELVEGLAKHCARTNWKIESSSVNDLLLSLDTKNTARNGIYKDQFQPEEMNANLFETALRVNGVSCSVDREGGSIEVKGKEAVGVMLDKGMLPDDIVSSLQNVSRVQSRGIGEILR